MGTKLVNDYYWRFAIEMILCFLEDFAEAYRIFNLKEGLFYSKSF